MERLTAYDHPFFGRADNLVLGPLNLAETADAAGLTGTDAIDAHLASGGLPGVLRTWPRGTPALRFIERECADPAAALFRVPEAALMAEFPLPDQARRVLEAVGSGDRTQANIAASAGGRQGPMPSGSLSPLLRGLVAEKRVLAFDEPLPTRPGKPALYRLFAGSIKWLGTPFDNHDLSAMAAGVAEVPGFTVGRSGLVIVTRSGLVAGLDLGHVDLVWGPDDVVRAWRAESPSG
jgi:hypothetical protein